MVVERINIKIARVGSGNGDLPLPAYMSEHSSGCDLFAAVDQTTVIQPGQRTLIPTGIAVAVPPGYEAQIRPRSGLALKHGVTLVNTPGTIDADYRGEIGLIVINHGDEPFTIQRGERLAQMVIAPVLRAVIEEVPVLDATTRNDGGFGHTGK